MKLFFQKQKTIRRLVTSCFFLCLCVPAQAHSKTLDKKQVNQFIDEMVQEHGFDTNELRILFGGTKYSDRVLQAMSKPAEGLPWYKYRPIFLKEARIKKGVEFWKKHAATLSRAEKEYGVPPEIITAIIGVETRYGQYKGKDKVMDSLATLAFHYPKRAKFFRSELKQFLLLTREQEVDPLSLKGSYAGAMGIPQFISSSYRNYAIDFDGDDKKDLWNNPVDAIGSVANYFSRHGWRHGETVTFPVKKITGNAEALINKDLKPKNTLADLEKHDVAIDQKISEEISESAPLKLMAFEQKNKKDYWVGLQNFYVITRYNHSALYAMAVYQLAESIRNEYEK